MSEFGFEIDKKNTSIIEKIGDPIETSVVDKQSQEIFNTKIQKYEAKISGDKYPYYVPDVWMSLGTWVPKETKKGYTIEGIDEDCVVISEQVADRLDMPNNEHFFFAILLHEYGHKNSNHNGEPKPIGKESYRAEAEANNWARKQILNSYMDQSWGEKAFDYVDSGYLDNCSSGKLNQTEIDKMDEN